MSSGNVGAGRISEVERSLRLRWVVGSILHGVDPLSYFSFQPVLHDWCNKGRGMCYPVCGMVHIKEPLLLIDKSSLCGGSGFPFSLSEWSLTICLTPDNRRYNVLSASLNKTFLSLGMSSGRSVNRINEWDWQSANGLVGTGIASRYQLQPRACF